MSLILDKWKFNATLNIIRSKIFLFTKKANRFRDGQTKIKLHQCSLEKNLKSPFFAQKPKKKVFLGSNRPNIIL
jgi:hypothetical protein